MEISSGPGLGPADLKGLGFASASASGFRGDIGDLMRVCPAPEEVREQGAGVLRLAHRMRKN